MLRRERIVSTGSIASLIGKHLEQEAAENVLSRIPRQGFEIKIASQSQNRVFR
jgi:hypothetical protein